MLRAYAKVSRTAAVRTQLPRAFSRFFPEKAGLYDPAFEKDSCGAGIIANLKGNATRKLVEDANTMLVRMAHRGACGRDPSCGDGAGIMVGLPHSFFQKMVPKDLGVQLPEPGQYAAGNVFLSPSLDSSQKCKDVFERVFQDHGMEVLGWRPVPTDNSALGAPVRASEPRIEQVFVSNSRGLPHREFERDLLLARKLAGNEINNCLGISVPDFYVVSLSSQTISYKGQLTAEQLGDYFRDLAHPDFASHLALIHSRFSTNTFPSWERAQPARLMCHNGEINTLRGNINWMRSRGGGRSSSPFFGRDTSHLMPAVTHNKSDSGNFDSVLELLHYGSNRPLPQTMMMMLPEAWQQAAHMPEDRKAMYEYLSCLMEPWDGPATMAFTDGSYVGACMDRNGLRPGRFLVTHDDRLYLSSELGVVPDLPHTQVAQKGRLEPGKMFLVDMEAGELVSDAAIKQQMADLHPYGEWLQQHHIYLSDWLKKRRQPLVPFDFSDTVRRLCLFGHTSESLEQILLPMAVEGYNPLGSMGCDSPLAVLSTQPRMPAAYMKQLFAQVTNPPIDPIREKLVMSLRCPIGPAGNLFESSPQHARKLTIDNPILTLEEMKVLKRTSYRSWSARTLDATFPANRGPNALNAALDKLCKQAEQILQLKGEMDDLESTVPLLVISQRRAGEERLPVPSLLAVGAIHQHLVRTQLRPSVGLLVDSGDCSDVHDVATLLGFGADAVCPYLAYEALAMMSEEGLVEAKAGQKLSLDEMVTRYRDALSSGLLKVMSKMGISTLQSYKGAQVFEAVGLGAEVMEKCFTGTPSRLGGISWGAMYSDLTRLSEIAYPENGTMPLLPHSGRLNWRAGGEPHTNSPLGMTALQRAARGAAGSADAQAAFDEYTAETEAQMHRTTLRGLFQLNKDPATAVPLEEVEPASEIVKRFVTGAMSLGSISQEAHETLAVAMNGMGARSNTGEGGEDPSRFDDNRRSSIKQVASGRFGVTSHYLANSDLVQIKMAQGAKPGEGGELPGKKVSPYIGKLRYTTPGVGLVSPPPHHDIYSIEDLAQLILDLKMANPPGDVSVKLVSSTGVGVVAAGVAKARADHITVSGHDGGSGAAALTSIHHAGLPWELGLAEAQQTLVMNDLRSRVRLQVDGQLKTPRDVIVATALGAEEFGFATAPMIAMGCVLMRKCHLNTCPVGIATQDPVLRRKFRGQPEHVVNFFFLLAEGVRQHLADMGMRSLQELIGRTDKLGVDRQALHYKSMDLDLSPILTPAATLTRQPVSAEQMRHSERQAHGLESSLDFQLLPQLEAALDSVEPVAITSPVTNLDRSVGAAISHHVSKRHGAAGLPDDTIALNLHGTAGQSLGFALAQGVSVTVEGDCNDYAGKSLSGGILAVTPDPLSLQQGFVAEDNVVAGNVLLYGATGGSAFFRGRVGERFCVRNSGAVAVAEGVGDHGCEYMTGGRAVIIGETGKNFAAGMSGGIAYVYDPRGVLPPRVNRASVELESIDTEEEAEMVRAILEQHVARTGSTRATQLLDSWSTALPQFVKVMPTDYKAVLQEQAAAAAAAAQA